MMRKTLFVVGVALAVSCMAGISTMAEVEMGIQADQVDEGEELYRQTHGTKRLPKQDIR